MLVAPLTRSAPRPSLAVDGVIDERRHLDDAGGFILLSRHAYRPHELWQRWLALPDVTTVPAVRRAWLVELKHSSFLVVDCFLDTTASDTDEIEADLSRIAETLCKLTSTLHGWTPEWVNRTLVRPSNSGSPQPHGWLTRKPVRCVLQDDRKHTLEATFGWGNNTILGWDLHNDHPTQSEAVMGLVDAQYLWHELSATGNTTATIAHTIIERSTKISRQTFSEHLDSLDRMSDAIALHRLDYDDLLMHIQGARHDVARACLDAWGYTEVFERVTSRLPIVTQATERELARSSKRYQSIVQTILTLVALLAATDFAIGLYSLAISGTSVVPSQLSLALQALSGSSVDLLLLVGLLSAIFMVLLQRRGKDGSR